MTNDFVIYDQASGIVLSRGRCGSVTIALAQVQTGQEIDQNAPPGVVADGLWQWTRSGYVHNTPPGPTLAEAQETQVALLQAAYAAAINQPVSFTNAAGVTSTYSAGNVIALNGATAARNLSNVITPGAAAWKMGKWLDTNNVAQSFTYDDLQGLAGAMEAEEVLDWTDLVSKVADVQAATTISAVQGVTF